MSKYLLFILLTIIIISSCKKEKTYTNSNASLNFSTDTLFFDTVFTTIGSTTKQLMVYNNNKGLINISNIRLANGNNSNYRLNINGVNNSLANDIELAKGDSLYIFVEVTIDPNNLSLPFVVEDSIIFNLNGNSQDIDLRSWGQNANYIDGRYESAIIRDTTWTKEKPFLIYNSMLVDTGETLIIEEGTEIYLHKNSSIYIMGTLMIRGTKEEPVIIKGDRLEHAYDDMPGQWSRLIFLDPSKNNTIDYAEIKGGTIGVQVGGNIESENKPDLLITNSRVEHMSYAGLYCIGSTVIASNCIFADVGFYSVALLMGGNYEFYHTTIANYWRFETRKEPSLVITNNLVANSTMYISNLVKANFYNSIIYGSLDNELGLNNNSGGEFNYEFNNCIVKANGDMDFSDNTIYKNVWKDKNPNFTDYSIFNWHLNSESEAINLGDINYINTYPYLPSISNDLDEENRIGDGLPDIGAYEFIDE